MWIEASSAGLVSSSGVVFNTRQGVFANGYGASPVDGDPGYCPWGSAPGGPGLLRRRGRSPSPHGSCLADNVHATWIERRARASHRDTDPEAP